MATDLAPSRTLQSAGLIASAADGVFVLVNP
jgi:hypothetical protein